jgi:hypothetical protein
VLVNKYISVSFLCPRYAPFQHWNLTDKISHGFLRMTENMGIVSVE